jgi:hypothetical protein
MSSDDKKIIFMYMCSALESYTIKRVAHKKSKLPKILIKHNNT